MPRVDIIDDRRQMIFEISDFNNSPEGRKNARRYARMALHQLNVRIEDPFPRAYVKYFSNQQNISHQ